MRIIPWYEYTASALLDMFKFLLTLLPTILSMLVQTPFRHNIYLIGCISVTLNTTLGVCLLAVRSYE